MWSLKCYYRDVIDLNRETDTQLNRRKIDYLKECENVERKMRERERKR